MNLKEYKTLIFDCDGVILDSNKIKTAAFYAAALPYGDAAANSLVDYHVRNGGVSRYQKFKYFLTQIVGSSLDDEEMNRLLSNFGNEVRRELLGCRVAEHLGDFRTLTFGVRWLVVSGSDQVELNHVFERRGLSDYFCGGIFGSPDDKYTIIERKLRAAEVERPVLYLGDSRYDFEVANSFGFDFVFVSGWSEFEGWRDYFKGKSVISVNDIAQLVSSQKHLLSK